MDSISSTTLEEIIEFVAYLMAETFNISVLNGDFPSLLKEAIVIHVSPRVALEQLWIIIGQYLCYLL